MNILYFYQYFSTSNGSWGTRVHEFAREWVKEGHNVTVVSAVYTKSDLKVKNFLETQIIDGVVVKTVNVKIDNKQPFFTRIFTFLIYALVSSWYALTIKTDIVIASSGPITTGIPGLISKYIWNRKLVFEVRDLWPDGAIELGILKNNLLKQISFWFENLCYRSSDLIVALSPGMRDEIVMKSGHNNVISVTNSANIDLFSTPLDFPESILEFEPNKFALYCGNIGEVNNVQWMFDAAKILYDRGRKDIKIVWIGDGQLKEKMVKFKNEIQLENLIILDLMPKNKLVAIVQHALISLVPLKDVKILNTSSPNKFFESLAAGVPVIQTTSGWMNDYVKNNNVGFSIDPNKPVALSDKLIEIFDSPNLLSEMKLNAIQIAIKEFDKRILAKIMLENIIKL